MLKLLYRIVDLLIWIFAYTCGYVTAWYHRYIKKWTVEEMREWLENRKKHLNRK